MSDTIDVSNITFPGQALALDRAARAAYERGEVTTLVVRDTPVAVIAPLPQPAAGEVRDREPGYAGLAGRLAREIPAARMGKHDAEAVSQVLRLLRRLDSEG